MHKIIFVEYMVIGTRNPTFAHPTPNGGKHGTNKGFIIIAQII